MRKPKPNTGWWAYLEKQEGFEAFTDTQLAEHKRTYWKEYDRLYKSKKRTIQKREISIAFAEDSIKNIRATAKAKGYNLQTYIRGLVKADMELVQLLPFVHEYREILQLLANCKNQLITIRETDNKNWLGLTKGTEKAEALLVNIEREISTALTRPKVLKTAIIESIQRNPKTIDLLQSILHEYDNQEPNSKDQIIPTTP